jgi:hypothetical protein
MKIETQTISTPETAFLLRAKLGPIRNWLNFLNDNIRGKQSVRGLTLLPCAQKLDSGLYRPVYSVATVKDFIKKVLALESSAGRTPIKITTLAIEDGQGWRVNKFEGDGSPVVSKLCRIFSHAAPPH